MQEGAQAPQRASSPQCCLLRYMLLSGSHSHKTGWEEPHHLPPVLQVRHLTFLLPSCTCSTSHHIISFCFTGHKLSQKNSSIIILHYFSFSFSLSPTSSLLTEIHRACRTAMMQARISGKQFAYSILSYLSSPTISSSPYLLTVTAESSCKPCLPPDSFVICVPHLYFLLLLLQTPSAASTVLTTHAA